MVANKNSDDQNSTRFREIYDFSKKNELGKKNIKVRKSVSNSGATKLFSFPQERQLFVSLGKQQVRSIEEIYCGCKSEKEKEREEGDTKGYKSAALEKESQALSFQPLGLQHQ